MSSSSSEKTYLQESRYRGVNGNEITLIETKHRSSLGPTTTGYENAAIEYVLKDVTSNCRRGFSILDITLLSLSLVIWTATSSPCCATLGLLILALAFRTTFLADRTNTLLVVESVGVHIINRKTIFGALEEYLPWSAINDIFINEVITEQKVLYYLTFIVKEFSSNGEERTRLIPLFRDLKPERECLEYIKNTADFSYSKELMKIIRRVIKWQPRQGQHFSTKNLLVTYNHAPWTRQDKMFAVMKFCDRQDASAFPHAFILTVKLLNQDESQQQTEDIMGGSSAKPASENPITRVTDDVESSAVETNSPLRDNKDTENKITTNGHEESQETKEAEDLPRSPRTRSRLKDLDLDISNDLPASNISPLEEDTKLLTSPNVDNANVADSSENASQAVTEITEESLEKNQESPIDDDDEEDEDETCSNSDSASLPYQYLIEKDIERELQNSKLAKESESSPCDSSLDSSSKSRKSNGKPRSRQESRDNNETDVSNLKSSDITDLVMKGLMFTIRQDEDTVTVVEQKTKLEVDEVLENSEKVETKEGDPCLLNSSLLRLEKMVTRIQGPTTLSSQNNPLVSYVDAANEIKEKTDGEVVKKDINQDSETSNCWSQLFGNKEMSETAFKNIEKALGDSNMYLSDENTDEDLELKMEDEEDEDIAPETLGNHKISDNTLDAISKMPLPEESFEKLLMDDIDPLIEKETDTTDTGNGNKDSTKLPKVISDQVITNDQIPPALLKALKNKCTNTSQEIIDDEKVENNVIPEERVKTNDASEEQVKNNNESDFKSIEVSSKSKMIEQQESINKSDKENATAENNISGEFDKNSDSSNSSVRLTRSNSKLQSNSNSTSKSARKIERQQSETSASKSQRGQKRKRSGSDLGVSKFCKSVVNNGTGHKEVKIEVCKLINDLTHGVKVVVERIDIKNIPR